MSAEPKTTAVNASFRSVHGIGVACGLAAGVWLGAAEAPTKLVNSGLSPYAISLCMVAGVFTARWTVPTLLKGTRYVFADLAKTSTSLSMPFWRACCGPWPIRLPSSPFAMWG